VCVCVCVCRGRRRIVTTIAAMLFIAVAAPARSQTDPCRFMNDPGILEHYPNPGGLNEYRINVANFSAALGLTQGEAVALVGHAAAAWNLNGSTGFFRYIGTTNREGPIDFCNDSGNWNLVTMNAGLAEDCDGNGYAFAVPVCNDTRWWINLCTNVPRSWSFSGFPASNEADLVVVATHEFGHVLNLAHPPGVPNVCSSTGRGATMCPDLPNVHLTRQRDIYPWETECLFRAASGRDLDLVAAAQVNGNFQSPQLYADAPNAYQGHISARWSGSNVFWSRALRNIGLRSLVSSLAWWPERSDELRAYYHAGLGSPSWTQPWGLGQVVYPVNLSSSSAAVYFRHCVGSSSCTSTEIVRSAHRLAHAWDDYNDSSVTVWAHQNRLNSSQEREIRIAHDVVGVNTVGLPHLSGRRTTVAPAIACKAYQADGYDCIVAYVPFETAGGTIVLGMFYRNFQGQYYWRASNLVLPYSTYTGVALWYSSGYWWLAYNDFYVLLAR
jgi:hypothetical protein